MCLLKKMKFIVFILENVFTNEEYRQDHCNIRNVKSKPDKLY